MANILTVSIGSMSIKLCEVSYSGNNVHLHKAVVINTPQDSVDDGFIKDESEVISAIAEALKEHKFQAKTVIFSIFSSRIASKEVMLPNVKEKRLGQLISINASEYFPVNIDQYIVTHKTLEEVKEEEEKQLRVLVLAAPKELVTSCYSIGYKLGLYVERVDYAGNSVVQIASREIGPETSVVIHIQEDNATINILEHHVLKLQRIVPYGKRMVVQALAEEEGIEEADAEELLREGTWIHDHFDGDPVTGSLRYLVNSISRGVDYYISRNKDAQIEKAYITGESAGMPGLEALFANEFDLPFMKQMEMENVVISSNAMIDRSMIPGFVVNLGAGISPADFIPTEEVERVNKAVDFKLLNLGLFAAVMVSIVIIAVPLVQYMSAISSRDAMQERVDELKEVETIVNDYYNAYDINHDVLAYDAMSKNANRSFRTFIDDLEKRMPSDISFGSVTLDNGNITLNCTGCSKESVVKFMDELEDFGYVSDIVVSSLIENEDENGNITESFTITCQLMDEQETIEE